MRKTIIALYGTENVGKSMTISRLGKTLNDCGGKTVQPLPDGDYRAVFDFRNHKIGIQTYGDTNTLVNEGLDFFQQSECDLIVIASRAYGNNNGLFHEFCRTHHFRCIWISPYQVWDDSMPVEEIKEYCAVDLMLLINDIIDEKL